MAGNSSVADGGLPQSKRPRKRLGVNVTAPTFNFRWISDFNLDGKVKKFNEIGDGATSKVFTGDMNGERVAVKQLKSYSPRLAPTFVKAYEPLFNLRHDNIVRVLGLCPQEGSVVLEYCEKRLGKFVLHTLADVLLHLGKELPLELQLNALADIADGLDYMHKQRLVHGDIKPANVLVCGNEENEYTFKLADYSCNNMEGTFSKSSCLRQLMTPGYVAPELFGSIGNRLQPTAKSDIYSFGILSYEIAFQREAWANVSIQLIDAVKHGYRPAIPTDASQLLVPLITSCWHENISLRPSTEMVLQLLEEAMNSVAPSQTSQSMVSTRTDVVESSVLAMVSVNESDCQEMVTNNVDESSFQEMADNSGGELHCHKVAVSDEQMRVDDTNAKIPGSHSEDELCQSGNGDVLHQSVDLINIKSILKITEFKRFQIDCTIAVNEGNDAIVVQPTGSGKSLCFVIPALLMKQKVSLVIEPVVAVILNQIESLQRKGINAVALGSAAGSSTKKSSNFHQVFHAQRDEPLIAFCTPEYLFDTPSGYGCLGTVGQFNMLVAKKDRIGAITIDEAHKIFDRLPSYHPAFNGLKKLKDVSCPIIAMSATLTRGQIALLQQDYLSSSDPVILKKAVYRSNLKLELQRYKRCRQRTYEVDNSDDEDQSNDDIICIGSSSSMWQDTVMKIKPSINGQGSVVYLDFVKDVEEVTELLKQVGFKADKYTGQTRIEDRKRADQKLLNGELSVLVATESYELGVDNPNINQVVRIGCPRNLSVLLQEIGRAGRQNHSTANGLLLFNETIDDKRLGLWLKSALDGSDRSPGMAKAKTDMIADYVKSWRFVYAVYHGKCLSWALSHFYGDDEDTPTCFVANSPLCSVCAESENICQETVDIQSYLVVLLQAINALKEHGLEGATKTLIVAILLKSNEQYIRKYEQLHDAITSDDLLWGCGKIVDDVSMSYASWHNVLYVAVHIGFLDLQFHFRPFDRHFEVHRRYCISSQGSQYLSDPHTVMSLDPCSMLIDSILGSKSRPQCKRTHHNRGSHLKPRILEAFKQPYIKGTIELVKYIGCGDVNGEDICLYFDNIFGMKESTTDPHFLLNCVQLSRTQSSVSEIVTEIEGVTITLKVNRSYCSGVKVCAGEGCHYTVSTKQRVNRCPDHSKTMSLVLSGSCNCHLVYVYPTDELRDGRRWVMALNSGNANQLHNHEPPAEWKIMPNVVRDITNTVARNSHIAPKEVQKGSGMNYQPMAVSIAAANIDRVRAVVKKAKRDVDKIDNVRVDPFAIIASFPAIKTRIDSNSESVESYHIEAINVMMGDYQIDGDDAYSFGRDRQYAFFQSPFQAYEWANADVLFADIDYTGCIHFKYLFNVACMNSVTKKYMACGRALLNRQDGYSIGKALSVLVSNVKKEQPLYNVHTDHREVLLDFDDAEANAFVDSFGENIANIIRGCSVHFMRSAMRVAKVVNPSVHSDGYKLFMAIAKRIPDEPSADVVLEALDILEGQKPHLDFSKALPPDVISFNVDTSNWKQTNTWVDWWKRPQVLKKLCKAFSSLDDEDWDELPGTTNPVESINRQSVPGNVKTVSLKPLIEHFYLEDKRQAIQQVACSTNVTITYHVKKRKRSRRPPKAPEKVAQLKIPTGKKAIGTHLSVEFYEDETKQNTVWYKGTVISYSRQAGYVISFEGYGPEENETIKSLKKAAERHEIKLL